MFSKFQQLKQAQKQKQMDQQQQIPNSADNASTEDVQQSPKIPRQSQFFVPRKRITNVAEVQRFQASPTFKVLQTWLKVLNNSVMKKPNSVECHISQANTPIQALPPPQ